MEAKKCRNVAQVWVKFSHLNYYRQFSITNIYSVKLSDDKWWTYCLRWGLFVLLSAAVS